jgi:N-acetylmuramoyl-L-alanine amidase
MRNGAALTLVILLATIGANGTDRTSVDATGPPVVVVDPGHGGVDYGARGPAGLLEKDLVLRIGRDLGGALEDAGYTVVYTRSSDQFVSLAGRTEIANKAQGEIFLSIHANASPDHEAAGVETFFLSTDATDEEALRVAELENAFLQPAAVVPGTEGVVGGILGDLIWTAHLERSSRLAAAVQRRLARLPGPSRGVKQAPFVVLMGVNMPAVLVETGFLTHPVEGQRLRRASHQRAIALGLAEALEAYDREQQEGDR